MWSRRSDVGGRRFPAVARRWNPFLTEFTPTDNGDVEAKGFYPSIVSILGKRLNFSIAVHELTTGTWGDMVDMVGAGEYEMSITGFSQIAERFVLVDFSYAFTSSSLRLFYRVMKKKAAAWLGS